MTDPGDHFAYPSHAPARPDRSFDYNFDARARCWLWDHDFALDMSTGRLFDYMDGDTKQAQACRMLREAKSRLDFPDGSAGYVCAHHSTFAQSVSDIWNANKEVHVSTNGNLNEQYGQGADGTAHITYYDKPTQLSFVWDGTRDSTIAVSHGGYAEPVIDYFTWTYGTFDLGDANGVEAGVGLLKWFERACRRYVDERYSTPAIVTAFRAGLEDSSEGYLEYGAETGIKQAYLSGRSIRAEITAGDA